VFVVLYDSEVRKQFCGFVILGKVLSA